MAAITSENFAENLVKMLAAEALPILRQNALMANLVNRNFENQISERGHVVNVRLIPSMTANVISEGGSVTTQNPSQGTVPVALTTHVEASFTIPDFSRAIAGGQVVGDYLKPAVIAVVDKIETDLMKMYGGLTSNAALGAGATDLTEAVVDNAEKALFNARAPMSSPKWLAVNSDQYSVIRQLARFSELDKIGSGDAIITGEVGTLKGLNVFRSHYVQTTAGPVDHNMAFQRDAFALVMRPLPPPMPGSGGIASTVSDSGYGLRVVTTYNGSTLSQQFTVDALFGIAVVRPELGVEVKS